jgi:hypothetical protein
MSDDTKITPESTYPEIKLPLITSDIPPHLLASMTPESKYILEQVSALGQYMRWSAPVLVAINQQTRMTNGRVISLEQTREKVTGALKSWWAIAGGIFAILGGIAAMVEIIEFVKAHWGSVAS